MEIVYYWLEECEGIYQQGFHLTPEIKVSMEVTDGKYSLAISDTGKINLMRDITDDVITNVTVLLGINGSGKTTLLNALGRLSCFAEAEEKRDEYKTFTNLKNLQKHCLYVMRQDGEYIIITNIKKDQIVIDDKNEIVREKVYYSDNKERLSADLNQGKGIYGISSVYLTNASFNSVGDTLGTHKGIEHISFTPEGLTAVSRAFFDFIYPEALTSREKTEFDQYSEQLKERKNRLQFQQFCDMFFCAYFYNDGNLSRMAILNKKEYVVRAGCILEIFTPRDGYSILFNQEHEACVGVINKKFEGNKAQDILYILKVNLIGEYLLAHVDLLNHIDKSLEMMGLYDYIVGLIVADASRDSHKEYFKNAVAEMVRLENILHNADIRHNTLPKMDLAYHTECVLKNGNAAQSFFDFIRDCIMYNHEIVNKSNDVKYGSFCIRYLLVDNLGLSSGERAYQNLISWLFWVSKMGDITSSKNTVPKKNLLVCIDEIDALCHPEWQRDIIGTIISTIENCFKGYKVQLVMSTHSPLCLSNIPVENIMFLRNDKNIGIYQDCSRHTQTFGRNIYDILNDSFYLNGETIGSFAVEYINEIIKSIKEGTPEELLSHKAEYDTHIKYIGDPLIREKLCQLFEEKAFKDKNVIKLRQLRRQREIINSEIEQLEKSDV